MSRPPFRFAVQATNASDARDWRDIARKVEDLGYSTLFLADHYLGPGPRSAPRAPRGRTWRPSRRWRRPRRVTETLRVGCRVFCIDYHVPAVLAKEAATLDLLSDGRLELGHRGGLERRRIRGDGAALRHARPSHRQAQGGRCAGQGALHRRRDRPAPVSTSTSRGYAGTPRPVQRPHPPIMIGGGGKRVLTYAAREADIVSISNVPFVATQRGGPDTAGRGASTPGFVYAAARRRAAGGYGDLDIESSPYFPSITDDPDGSVARRVASATGSLSRDSSRSSRTC